MANSVERTTKLPDGSRAVRIPWPPRQRRKLPEGISEDVCLSDIARVSGVSLAHISRVFGGTRRPSLGVASKIAAYLEMPIDRLYTILTECSKKHQSA